MTRAATILIFSTAALLLVAAPAIAQGMGGGGPGDRGLAQFGPDRFQPPPGDDFDQPPPRRQRDFAPGGDPQFRGDPRVRGGDPRSGGRRAGSNICITSRGSCDAGFVAPHNTPCRCIIPGFGEKNGAIQ